MRAAALLAAAPGLAQAGAMMACDTTTVCSGDDACNFVSAPAFSVTMTDSRDAVGVALDRIRLGLPVIGGEASLGSETLTYGSDRAELTLTFADTAEEAAAVLLIGETRYLAACRMESAG